jgi:hypothetical protein
MGPSLVYFKPAGTLFLFKQDHPLELLRRTL